MRESNQAKVFRDQFKRYTTYKLPKNIKALICVLAGLLTKIYIYRLAKRYGLVVSINKEVEFFNEKIGPEE